MKVLYIDLHMEGAISDEELDEISQCSAIKEVNGRIYQSLYLDPSVRNLEILSKVIRKYPSNTNNQELATKIKDFLQHM